MTSLNRAPIRALIATGALIASAVCVVLLVAGPSTDPRMVWVSAAEELCEKFNDAVTAEAGVNPADGDSVRSWAQLVADANTKLAEDLAEIPASGNAETLAAAVISEAKLRSELYQQVADAPDDDLPDATTGEGGPGAEISSSYRRVADAAQAWGAQHCSTMPIASTDIDPSWAAEAEAWFTAVEGACLDAGAVMVELDAAAGVADIDRSEYLAGVADTAAALAGELQKVGAPPRGVIDGNLDELTDAIAAFADTATSGGLAEAREANERWMSTANALSLAACARGVPASLSTPSGFIGTPAGILPVESGTTDGVVTDAVTVGGYATGNGFAASGIDPSMNFGLAEVLVAAIGAEVTVVDGATEASPAHVSLSAARPADPTVGPGPKNPWVVGVAFTDTSGACVHGRMFGYPRLQGYDVGEAQGPCTGDAAAARFALDPASEFG